MRLRWLVSTFATVLGSAGLAVSNAYKQTPWGIGWLVVCLVTLGVISWPERYNQRALRAILQLLLKTLDEPEGSDLRICIYVPTGVAARKTLTQACPYQPSNKYDPKRTQLATKGVQGVAYTERKDFHVRLEESDDVLASHFQAFQFIFGLSKDEAKRVLSDRRSYLALPIIDGENLIAILYSDSRNADSFNDPHRLQQIERFLPIVGQLVRWG